MATHQIDKVLIICASESELSVGRKLMQKFKKFKIHGVIEVLDKELINVFDIRADFHKDSYIRRKKKAFEDFKALVLFDDTDPQVDQVVSDFNRMRIPVFGVSQIQSNFCLKSDSCYNRLHSFRSCDYVLLPGERYARFFQDRLDSVKIVGSSYLKGIKPYLDKKEKANKVLINFEDSTGYNFYKDRFFGRAISACRDNNLAYETYSSNRTSLLKYDKERVEKLNSSSLCISNSSNCIFESLYLGIPVIYFEQDKYFNPLFTGNGNVILSAGEDDQLSIQLKLASSKGGSRADIEKQLKNELSSYLESCSTENYIENISDVVLSKIKNQASPDDNSETIKNVEVSNTVYKIIINRYAIYFYRNDKYFGLLNHKCELSDFLGIMIKKFNFEYSSLEDVTKNIKVSVFALATSYLNAQDDYSDTELSKLKQSFYNEFSGIIDEVAKKAKSLISLQS